MARVFVAVVVLAVLTGCDDREADVGAGAAASTSLVTGGCEDEATVFLRPETTDDDLTDVAEELGEFDGVDALSTFDQDQTYSEFVDLFADKPQIVETVTPDILPPSVRVQVEGDAVVDEIKRRYDADPRVREVVVPLDSSVLGELAEDMPERRRPCGDETG